MSYEKVEAHALGHLQTATILASWYFANKA